MFSDSMMLGGGRKAAFSIANSVRLDGVADYFTRTFGSPTAQGRWAFSLWFKRSQIGLSDRRHIFGGNSLSDSSRFAVFIDTNDSLRLDWGGESSQIVSSRKFRDVSAWYHLVMSLDGTASANQDRLRIWINGQRETDFAAFNASIPAIVSFNHVTQHFLGSEGGSGYFPGYFADVGFIDGAALDPSAFGETDPVTGSWRPKPIGNLDFGSNGFHLDFADGVDLGNDVSGKGNVWLPVSLGAADVVTDSPTNNYATINRLNMQSGLVLSNGNTSANGSAAVRWWRSSLAMSGGKWYFEMKANSANNSYCGIGIEPVAVTRNDGLNQYPGGSEGGADGYGLYTLASPPNQGIRHAHNGVYTDIADAGFNNASVMKVAVDLDAKMLWLGYDNTWIGGGDPAQGTSPTYTLSAQVSDWVMMGCAYNEVTCYFGASGFNLTVPAGFKSLCTANMPKPVIQAPSKHMDVVTYTGTGTSQVVTGLGFQPDLVWCKRRDNIESHGLYDSVRGPTKMLYSDLSNGEATDTNGIVSFNANGFAANGAMATNGSGGNYVAWCWKAGGAPVANTVGSIPSTVSANPTAGFSIAKYAGTGIAGISFGHGLSAAPKFILVKNVSSGNRNANTMDWMVFHTALGNSSQMRLNTTEGKLGPDAGMWNSTAPSTSVVTLGNHERVNYGGDNYIAYCWAEVPGFSKFGAYTGNGSSDGPFVHCGFRPRFVLIKRTDSAENWRMFDAARSPYNVVDNMLQTNDSSPEALGNANKLDFTANGFKVRSIDAGTNSNGTYIYAAFAEAPLGGAKTVPAKAR
ncbi:DUF7483 domain-containing protein [Magnetospirillum gryphiswaldense]|uniref:DUF7483 domain-containing protein n=1 Tax=Magnetospirillum gryphiswaldense TaxID=55518 RepID=A4TYE5_9PROT|nr:LamG-like jellyroll fold domain-containing protein [Magnetospirillum gryphiswaldense]AVM74728.1 hypothetical protein MSR1_22430 [Magnetospirillum gryphiswaldense MSR-1]AVM78631.1 hypothetical protein MSR1L_22430 [Magnetospirillum gryphiswaldense]CAM75652.1 conserved hypothetical protein [Magnetospirillum gryphiswaldense MSR-1]